MKRIPRDEAIAWIEAEAQRKREREQEEEERRAARDV